MKIAIVTEPLYCNYGCLLQNYALQQVLIGMGHEPVTLDFMPSLPFGRYLLYVAKNVLMFPFVSSKKKLKRYSHFLERPRSVARFVDERIVHTGMLERYSASVLKRYSVDAVVVGSDQVWRLEYNNEYKGNLLDMYLAFAGDEYVKIAYAASIGVEKWNYPDSLTEKCRTCIGKFSSVSVRENSAVELCREYLDAGAELVLDPTLLLEAGSYDVLLDSDSGGGCDKYLAVYILDMTDGKRKFIEETAAGYNLEVRYMDGSDNCPFSVGEWLTTIKNAEYVITDSYHGSLFSIIFGKLFVTFINPERGKDRFTTLFSRLGLESRLYEADGLADIGVLREPIDYLSVNKCLSEMRRHSLNYISKSLD